MIVDLIDNFLETEDFVALNNLSLEEVNKNDIKVYHNSIAKDKVIKFWIEQNLPVSKISLDTNTIKLNAVQLSSIQFDELLLQQLEIIKTKNSKLRKKKLY